MSEATRAGGCRWNSGVAVTFRLAILATFTPAMASETLPIAGTFCSYGTDSEGFESYPFEIGPNGYSDAKTTCQNFAFEDIGGGWIRVDQTCPHGQASMELKVSGDAMTAVLEDGHEYTLRRCE